MNGDTYNNVVDDDDARTKWIPVNEWMKGLHVFTMNIYEYGRGCVQSCLCMPYKEKPYEYKGKRVFIPSTYFLLYLMNDFIIILFHILFPTLVL